MTRFVLILTCAVAGIGFNSSASAQPKQKYAPQPSKLHYNPPSYYVQPPVPVTSARPVYGAIDCSPTIGFYGDMGRQGLLITQVTRRSEASRVGLVAGDVIIRADGARIRSQSDWERAMDRAGREICLTVKRANGTVADVHARLSHNGHQHGYDRHAYRPVNVVPAPPVYGYTVPQPPQSAYHFSFGDSGFRIGLTIRD